MDEWKELTQGRAFISDLGVNRETDVEGKPARLGRYAVWSPMRAGDGHAVVEVGEDLPELMSRYGVAPEMVFRLCRQ